ncbi:MAG: bacterioferritin [Promethearchaeota archaeon]
MPTKKNLLLDLLKQAIKGELRVSIQYMWQHIQWLGLDAFAVRNLFKQIAIQEMIHAEKIAERLFALEEKLPTEPDPIVVGDDLEEMLKLDKKAEEDTIKLYKQIIKIAQKQEDFATYNLFLQIIEEEEQHLDSFTSLLEDDIFKI